MVNVLLRGKIGMNRLARRDFLRTVGAAAGYGLTAGIGWPRQLLADSKGDLDLIASWLIETPRDRLLEQIVDRIREGLSYELLASAITQAAVRSVQPYPHVGFMSAKFCIGNTSTKVPNLSPLTFLDHV